MSMKLKHLLENSTEVAYKDLTQEEKKSLRENIKQYNSYRNSLRANSIYETCKRINETIELAERYACRESNEWMESKMIERDMKDIKKFTHDMLKESNKIKDIEKQIEMLYEQVGVRLERYFEIDDLIPDSPTDIQTDSDPTQPRP